MYHYANSQQSPVGSTSGSVVAAGMMAASPSTTATTAGASPTTAAAAPTPSSASSSSLLLNHSLSIRQEIQRFESVHPSIYAIYDLIELVPDPLLAQQIREHVVCIEGRKKKEREKTSLTCTPTVAGQSLTDATIFCSARNASFIFAGSERAS